MADQQPDCSHTSQRGTRGGNHTGRQAGSGDEQYRHPDFRSRRTRGIAIYPINPPDASLFDFAIAPNNSAIYYISVSGALYGITLSSRQLTPGSGINLTADSTFPFLLGFSRDSSRIILITSEHRGIQDNQPYDYGVNQAVVLNSANLTPIAGSPFPLTASTIALVTGLQTGRLFLAQPHGIAVLDGATYQPVTHSPVPFESVGLMAISSDESSLYAVGLDIDTGSFYLAKIDATSLQITTKLRTRFGFIGPDAQQGFPMASLAVSVDGGLLFFSGSEPVERGTVELNSRCSAYDTNTMQEVNWSPLSFGEFLPIDFAMSPDGTRLFVLTSRYDSTQNFTTLLYAVAPTFS